MFVDFTRAGAVQRMLTRQKEHAHPLWGGLPNGNRFIDTSFLTGNRLTQEKWPQTMFEWKQDNMLLSKFMGTGPENIIQVNQDLARDQVGDKINLHIIPPLTGAGGGDDGEIEDNEEAMSDFNMRVVIHERSHGVRDAGKMSAKRTKFVIRRDGTIRLGEWAAQQEENDIVYGLSGLGNQNTYVGEGTARIQTVNELAPSSNRIFYGGMSAAGTVLTETSDSLIGDAGASDYLNYLFGTKIISIVKRKMMAARPKFKPLMINGKGFYIGLIHALQSKALRGETSAVNGWSAIQAAANVRGINNPLFTKEGSGMDRIFDGAIGVYDDVILYEYDKIQTRTGGEAFGDPATVTNIVDESYIVSGTSAIARALFLGAQAGCMAIGQQWARYEKQFDYGRRPGTAIDALYGFSKTRFNDPGANQTANDAQEDHAVFCVDTAVALD